MQELCQGVDGIEVQGSPTLLELDNASTPPPLPVIKKINGTNVTDPDDKPDTEDPEQDKPSNTDGTYK